MRKMAVTRGFEPPIRCYPYNGLANRRLQPLGHVTSTKKTYYYRDAAFLSCLLPQAGNRSATSPKNTKGFFQYVIRAIL